MFQQKWVYSAKFLFATSTGISLRSLSDLPRTSGGCVWGSSEESSRTKGSKAQFDLRREQKDARCSKRRLILMSFQKFFCVELLRFWPFDCSISVESFFRFDS
eukprot:GHVP01016317.1.p1 GENE.GHVP01016317.1~~GHVP01016317.1.p1  ORF type:complete len:103 (+),score=13.55 GHVP01016317.1:211-519(+)